MFVLGSIHTVAHFASWEFHAEMYRCWIAGVLLYLIFAVITYTAVKRVGKGAAYRPFVWIHNLQNLVLPLAVLHVPFRWYVLGVLCFIALLHECMKWRRTYVADLSGSSRVGASTSLLSVVQFRTGGILATVPGAYYRIKIPALSVIECTLYELRHHLRPFPRLRTLYAPTVYACRFSTWCPGLTLAGWALRSDAVSNSRLQGIRLA